MSHLSTVAWLHKTFPTRQRTAELLRPELEEHALSQHDYELATRFLPGPNVNQLVYGAGTSAAVYGYGSYFARPKWRLRRLCLASATAYFVGSTYGIFRHLLLHYHFLNTLENPHGFIAALNHVDERLGGSGQIGFALTKILVKEPEIEPSLDRRRDVQDGGTVSREGRDQNQANGSDLPRSDPDRPRTRWDEIRAANSPSADHSSWDSIRQLHERRSLPDPSIPLINEAQKRTAAEAEFDALLEAERCGDQPPR